MKIVYIAHPLGGDVEGNLDKVIQIIRKINLEEPDVVPFAHYFVDCHALNDNEPEERERGIKNDIALFKKRFIDEVRLYGDKISPGMREEIKLAHTLDIPVKPMTDGTLEEYDSICINYMTNFK